MRYYAPYPFNAYGYPSTVPSNCNNPMMSMSRSLVKEQQQPVAAHHRVQYPPAEDYKYSMPPFLPEYHGSATVAPIGSGYSQMAAMQRSPLPYQSAMPSPGAAAAMYPWNYLAKPNAMGGVTPVKNNAQYNHPTVAIAVAAVAAAHAAINTNNIANTSRVNSSSELLRSSYQPVATMDARYVDETLSSNVLV